MSPRILISALALLSLGLGLVAWRQHAARLELENQLRLATQKAAEAARPAPARPATPAAVAAQTPATRPAPPAMDPDIEARRAQISARNDTPEVQRLMDLSSRSALDSKYASLFKYLGLPPEKLQKLQALLQDRQNVFRDVTLAMRTQGIAPTPENGPKIQALVNNAAGEVEAQISASLGEADYARYKTFESAQMPRVTAERVQQRLSYSPEPLTDSQYTQLVDALIQSDQASRNQNPGAPTAPPVITASIVDQLRPSLSPAQLAALQGIQREQEASTELASRLNTPPR